MKKYILSIIIIAAIIISYIVYSNKRARRESFNKTLIEMDESSLKFYLDKKALYKKFDRENDSLTYNITMLIAKMGSAGEIKMLRHEKDIREEKEKRRRRDEELQVQIDKIEKSIQKLKTD